MDSIICLISIKKKHSASSPPPFPLPTVSSMGSRILSSFFFPFLVGDGGGEGGEGGCVRVCVDRWRF